MLKLTEKHPAPNVFDGLFISVRPVPDGARDNGQHNGLHPVQLGQHPMPRLDKVSFS